MCETQGTPQTFVCKTEQWEARVAIPSRKAGRGGAGSGAEGGLAPRWRTIPPDRQLVPPP